MLVLFNDAANHNMRLYNYVYVTHVKIIRAPVPHEKCFHEENENVSSESKTKKYEIMQFNISMSNTRTHSFNESLIATNIKYGIIP